MVKEIQHTAIRNMLAKIAVIAICVTAFATAETHFTFTDSTQQHEVSIRAQLVDSVVITNLDNAPTHYDNAMSVQLFLDGHFTKNFNFGARVKVHTDYTNRDIVDNFYNPNEGIPYNKQSENRRTWDLFAAHADYNLKPVTLLAGFDYIEWVRRATTT